MSVAPHYGPSSQPAATCPSPPPKPAAFGVPSPSLLAEGRESDFTAPTLAESCWALLSVTQSPPCNGPFVPAALPANSWVLHPAVLGCGRGSGEAARMWVTARDTLCTSPATPMEGCVPFCVGRRAPAPSHPHSTQGCCQLKSWPRRDQGLKLLLMRCFCETGRGYVWLVCSLISKGQLKSESCLQDQKARNGTTMSRGCRNS